MQFWLRAFVEVIIPNKTKIETVYFFLKIHWTGENRADEYYLGKC